ncbi:MAG: FAD/NAD(P)-binding protein [Gammaproteobacteria bacterium]
MNNHHLQHEVEIVDRVAETETVFTLSLKFTDPEIQTAYQIKPGQFNMLYLYGVGEVAISIVSDLKEQDVLIHTIRAVGRVTNGLAALRPGDRIGLRGPYGTGWPMKEALGNDIVIITGGLGCVPAVSVINYIMQRRDQYGKLTIMQGVKHYHDLLWRERYQQWAKQPDTQVLLASDVGAPIWPFHVGSVMVLFDKAEISGAKTTVMMCGPEGMMRASVNELTRRSVKEDSIWLSMERNMQCGIGQCGHCQMGGLFVCKDGPVFQYPKIKSFLSVSGF